MLTVQIPTYTLSFPKDKLQAIFPESILTQAAEFDDSVQLTSPLLTPSLLQLLHTMVTTERIPDILPTDIDYVQASNYLNIPILIALADPWFPTFRYLHPEINVLPTYFQSYANALNSAIGGEATLIAWFILNSAKPDLNTETVEADAFIYAVWLGVAGIIKIMLSRVNPTTARAGKSLEWVNEYDPEYKILKAKPNQALLLALYQNRSDVIALLLADARTHLDAQFDYWRVIKRLSTLNFQRLIQHPDTTPQILSKFQALESASDAARLLFSHPQYDPSLDQYSHLDSLVRAMDKNIQTVVQRDTYDLTSPEVINANLIYWNPKTNPTEFWNDLLYNAHHDIEFHPVLPTGLVEGWVLDPRLVLDELRRTFYECLLWMWSPRVLEKFLQKYPHMKPMLQEYAQEPIQEALNSPEEIDAILNRA
jgi:hypothetical protein